LCSYETILCSCETILCSCETILCSCETILCSYETIFVFLRKLRPKNFAKIFGKGCYKNEFSGRENTSRTEMQASNNSQATMMHQSSTTEQDLRLENILNAMLAVCDEPDTEPTPKFTEISTRISKELQSMQKSSHVRFPLGVGAAMGQLLSTSQFSIEFLCGEQQPWLPINVGLCPSYPFTAPELRLNVDTSVSSVCKYCLCIFEKSCDQKWTVDQNMNDYIKNHCTNFLSHNPNNQDSRWKHKCSGKLFPVSSM
jgi:hypothetical protein